MTSPDKKVLILNALYYPNIGGVENSIRELSQVLKDKGYAVDVVCSNRNYTDTRVLEDIEHLESATVYRYDYPAGIKGYFLQFINCYRLLRKLKADNPYTLVVARHHVPVLCAKAAGFKNIHYMVASVQFFQDLKLASWKRPLALTAHLIRSGLQSLAFLSSNPFVFSDTMARQVRKASGMMKTPQRSRPGISLQRFHPVGHDQKLQLRLDLFIPTDKKVLLCVGRFSELKQFDIAIQAMAFLDDSFHLVLVGDGPERGAYEKLIDRYGLSRQVSLRASSLSPEAYYQASDAFLMTSRYEAFGQVLLEATASGLPIVAFSSRSGVNTATESVYSGTTTLVHYVHRASAKALAQGIVEALRKYPKPDPSERQRFIEPYSWEQTVDTLIQG